MSLQLESVKVANIIESLKAKIGGRDAATDDQLSSIVCMLGSPCFQQLLTLQDSIQQLKQISSSQNITGEDFDFSPVGELLISESFSTDKPDGTSIKPVNETKLAFEALNEQAYPGPGGAISTHKYNIEFQRAIEKAAQGREVETIQLLKEENKSLGFSVVGLKSEHQGDLGIFVQGIQPGGIADKDGRLQEGDQILAIDGQALDISHHQAIRILQSARGLVEVVVARGSIPTSDQSESETTQPVNTGVSDNNADMVLNTDWTQIEVIDVINDGSGLGFGIIGGRSTGVVVKTILPGGVADTDGRLRSGDHILQIGDVNVRGMSSEQVASVLRQSGSHVRLVVARAVMEPAPTPIPHAPIIPTNQLDEQLQNLFSDSQENIDLSGLTEEQIKSLRTSQAILPGFLGAVEVYPPPQDAGPDSPEMEMFDVELIKDTQGLGITIAGYVGGEKTLNEDELSGIFVKSISEGSAAAVDGRILVNDQIVEVDGQSLQGFTNHQAVDVLRNTGQVVHLKLIRYKHGPKFEQLQQYHAQANQLTGNGMIDGQPMILQNGTTEEFDSFTSQVYHALNKPVALENVNIYTDDYSGELLPDVEAAIKACWEPIVGDDFEVTVAQLSKFQEGGGLGISLEGTVDVENGVEVRPHHYIRSILPQGPVGLNGRLQSGDELLEVNGKRLLGLNHVEVVSILKELPRHVRIVCARRKKPAPETYAQNKDDQFFSSSFYTGVQASSAPMYDRLVKSKSEMALSSPDRTAVQNSLNKMKSRSLEPLTGLAMWSSEPVVIELTKGDKGLGFSILDYQDPMNPSDTVIVIRSLVPGGVAQQDGRLVPGDRLIFVGDVNLENATLDEAVQALKGAPKGVVRIGVAKPLPIPESLHDNPEIPTINPTVEVDQMLHATPAELDEDIQISDEETPCHDLEEAMKMDSPLILSSDSEPESRGLAELDLEREFEENLSREDLAETTKRLSFTSQTLIQDQMSPASMVEDVSMEPANFVENHPPQYNEVELSETIQPVWDDDQLDAPPVPQRTVAETSLVLEEPVEFVLDTELDQHIEQPHEEQSSGSERDQSELTPPVIPAKPLLAPKPYSLLKTVQGTRAISKDKHSTSSPGTISVRESTEFPVSGIESKHSLSVSVVEKEKTTHVRDKAPPPVPPKPKITLEHHSIIQASPPPPPLSSPPPLEEETKDVTSMRTEEEIQVSLASHFLHMKTESMDSSVSSSSDPITSSDLKAVSSPSTPCTLSPGMSPLASPSLMRAWSSSPNALPASLEKTIKIKKGNDNLGLTVESVEKGINGCVVKSLAKGGALTKDGSITTGDYIISINNETMRRITNAQARAILRRASLLSTDISITYLTAADVVNFRETASVDSRTQSPPAHAMMTSPNSPLSTSLQKESPVSSPTKSPLSTETATTTITDSTDLSTMLPSPISTEVRLANTVTSPSGASTSPVSSPSSVSSPRQKSLAADGSPAISEQTWGPARVIHLEREPGKSLGISIVGGRVDMFQVAQENTISGIFIKHVLEDSPAGKNGTLKTGDRILEVDGVDLRNATHDQAVEVIRKATNPVKFVVQNLVDSSCPRDLHESDAKSVQSYEEGAAVVSLKQADVEDTEATQTMQEEIAVLAAVPGGETETEPNLDKDDPYSQKCLQEKYGELNGELLVVDLNRSTGSLGISLAGNKDRSTMSVFVAGIQPESIAAKDGRIQVGDELLEVNGQMLHGRSHLNASAIIKGLNTPIVKIVVLRRDDSLEHMAVKPLRLAAMLPSPESAPVESPPAPIQILPAAETSESSAQVKTVYLEKGTTGLGFAICEGTEEGKIGIFVKNITPGGVAAEEGTLRVGNQILEVDETSLEAVHYDKAIEALRRTHGTVKLKVYDNGVDSGELPAESVIKFNAIPGESTTDPVESPSVPQSPPPDPKTCLVEPGREVQIEIEKGSTGLGLSIVGGADTLLGSIIVHEVYADGAAARDNRLKPGDQILEVNYEDLREASHDRAIQVLRQTPAKVQMVVFRDDNQLKEEDLYDIFSVELIKKPGKGLGISIVGKRNDVGVYISDVVKSGAAEADGRLMQGDQILAVNGTDFRSATQDYAAAMLKTLMGKVSLTVGRLKAGSRTSSRRNSGTGTGLRKSDSNVSNKLKGKHSKGQSEDKTFHGNTVRLVQLNRDESGSLGLSIAGGIGSPLGDVPIMVANLNPTGPANRSQKLKVGDHILSINGESTESMTLDQAVQCLKNATGPIKMRVTHGEDTTVSVSGHTNKAASMDAGNKPTYNATSTNECQDDSSEMQCKKIILNRGVDGLGFSIVGGHGSPHGDLPIYVKNVFSKGAAAEDGTLKRGDQILAVNGESLEGLTHEQAVSILKQASGTVTLTVLS